MKKKICLLAAICMTAALFLPVSVHAAGEPGYVINFKDQDQIDSMVQTDTAINDGDYTYEDGIFKWVTENVVAGDPDFKDPHIMLTIDDTFSADDYPYAKFKIMNKSNAVLSEFHFSTDVNALTVSTKTHFDISANDTDWKTYIVDIRTNNVATIAKLVDNSTGLASDPQEKIDEPHWTGEVTGFRYDMLYYAEPGGEVPDGDTMYIDYIAFFKTVEDAEAFTEPTPATPKPTPTATPEATATPVKTAAATATATSKATEKPGDSDGKIDSLTLGLIIGGGVLVVGAAVIVIVSKMKKKK